MSAENFTWDKRKAAANYAKHGVTFEMARDVFKDPFAVDREADRELYGEERYTIIGMVEGRFVVRRLRDEGRHYSNYLRPRSRTL